jgi:energy-coupling factor transporter ATP-binding protein EcfA2
MPNLKVDLKNCYGIREFKEEFKFDTGQNVAGITKCYAIYASNGSMKSSFADTFYAVQEKIKGEPRDRMYPERKPVCSILWDGSKIDPESIYVVKTLDDTAFNEPPAGVARLLVNENLKKEYEKIYTNLELEKENFIKKLKKVSGSSDCEEELLSTFSGGEDKSIYEILKDITPIITGNNHQVYKFKYNDVFDKAGKVKEFVKKNQELLQDYATTYNRLLKESPFFSDDSSFGTYQAKEINKGVKGDGFFGAGHRFRLKGEESEVESSKQFSEIIESEIKRIVSDDEARATFNKIDTALQANQNLRNFQSALNIDNSIAAKIINYEEFKAQVWHGFLSEVEKDLLALVEIYDEVKPKLDEITKKAETEQKYWKDAIDEFNRRFKKLPFSLDVVNRKDVVLNAVTPTIDFVFDDKQEEGSRVATVQELKKVLSHGEKRALHLLSIIFDIKARQADDKETLFIFDDAVDSFDYKNKYAIVQYLKDITNNEKFYVLIFTHNFDFFRTIDSRGVVNYSDCLSAYKDSDNIKLKQMIDFKNPFKSWRNDLRTNQKKLIASIPFVRNIVEYTRGEGDEDYKKLTKMLHIKKDTLDLKVTDLNDILSNNFDGILLPYNGENKIFDMIISNARACSTSAADLSLEEKIVLSVASRLSAEAYVRGQLSDEALAEIEDVENQTFRLFKLFRDENPDLSDEIINQLDEVLLMTPENIHLNAFMYEPIIDLGSEELRSLFKDTERLLK